MQTRILQRNEDSNHAQTVSNPGLLVQNTPNGRRLVPGSRVVIKNHGLSRRDIIMNINSLGFRDNEISQKKGKDEFRILVLGDSITWGDYLQAEEVYVERVEHYLNGPGLNKKIEVINAGVGDIGLPEELSILRESVLAVSPDLVVVAFYLNDSRPPWGFSAELGHPGWLRQHSMLVQVFYRLFVMNQWISEKGAERFEWVAAQNQLNWKTNIADLQKLAFVARYDWGAAWQTDSWGVVEREFKQLKKLSQQHGFRTVVVSFPVSFQVYANVLDDTPQRKTEKLAKKYGFGYLDLLPEMRKHRDKNLFFDQCHPRVEANDIIGRTIANYLISHIKSGMN